MKTHPVIHPSSFILYVLGLGTLFLTCNRAPDTFENIVDGEKIRPFAVVCNPPDASPGDTVAVRLYYYAPPADSPSIHWLISLDYGADLYGNEFEKQVVDLDGMMLPGSTPDTFRFVVPESTLLYSSQLAALARQPTLNPWGFSVPFIDSALREAAALGAGTPLLDSAADKFSCQLKLRAQMRAGISLDVTMLLRVRYSRRLGRPEVNVNPAIRWMGLFRVPEGTSVDSAGARQFQYLYNLDYPDSVRDTVIVDSGYNYYLLADSGINGPDTQLQTYTYYSSALDSVVTDPERVRNSWFYTNLDYHPGMVMDSLIMISGGGRRSRRSILPPVDTAMHRFQLYLVARDQRPNDPGFTPGEAFLSAPGYFLYTPAYARGASRNTVSNRFFD